MLSQNLTYIQFSLQRVDFKLWWIEATAAAPSLVMFPRRINTTTMVNTLVRDVISCRSNMDDSILLLPSSSARWVTFVSNIRYCSQTGIHSFTRVPVWLWNSQCIIGQVVLRYFWFSSSPRWFSQRLYWRLAKPCVLQSKKHVRVRP